MPQPQNYKNHVRWYPPHHFVFYPLMLILIVGAVYQVFSTDENQIVWIFITVMLAVIVWVAFMMRQHYALTLQNRLVLTELRYRYFVITGQRFELLEKKLTEGQLFGLRFAPDNELEELVGRTIREQLSPDAVKRTIVNWRADNHRV